MLKRPDYSKPLAATLEPEFVSVDDSNAEEITKSMTAEDREKFISQFEELKIKYINFLTQGNESK